MGNRNRLKHGAFSRAAAARRSQIDALVAQAEALIARAGMVARARKALRVKQARGAAACNPRIPVILRIAVIAQAICESWLTRLAARAPPLALGMC
jgi:glycyl-tRNA synthetase alpha subunit